ncbi:DUF4381 domain-containing protein [Microbulbifer halophilus]|uniref:DUF4381 domain-containing protein n=1 Tax=Microbulbifer halophilus TaxID=453963 RepID=A0ABW5EFN5_9GAMM|nr:DUF4381 domain-containing protein [Microbulbifer halophilus]MCW8128352.1 DUF4381 domain-containing protein [Microbulbifer halophilus]
MVKILPMQQQPAPPQLSPEEKELLAQLHDIHEPAPIGWWPPAPGWWLLAALTLAAIAAALLWLRRRRQRREQNRYREEAVRLLQAINPADTGATQDINEILKRVAVTTFGRARCGNLIGRQWLGFLGNTADIDCPDEAEKALLEHLYRDDHPDETGNRALRDYAVAWVQSHSTETDTKRQAATTEAQRV